MSVLRKRIRVERTQQQLETLRRDVVEWLIRRRAADKRKQFSTQLTVLEAVLTGGLGALEEKLAEPALLAGSEGTVYSACAEIEQRLLLQWQLWNHYREKFDQRDDSELAPTLAAADEIVWSCYKTPFDRVDVERPSAPLAYLDASYSPEAHARIHVPRHLRPLKGLVEEMPMPVVSLPLSCLGNPWWLILLAHEVGHQVQYDLVQRIRLVEHFQKLVETIAATHQNPGAEPSSWRGWATEIFADAFSLLLVGPWALWAMADLGRIEDRAMLEPSSRYPAAVVRLTLMKAMIDALGITPEEDMLRGLEPGTLIDQLAPAVECERLRAQVNFTSDLAAAVLDPEIDLCGLGDLRRICGWQDTERELKPRGLVNIWKQGFCDGERRLHPSKTLEGARLAISAATAAWAEVAKIEDAEDRRRARGSLAASVLEMVPRCREDGTRSASARPERGELDLLSQKAGQLILEAELEDDE